MRYLEKYIHNTDVIKQKKPARTQTVFNKDYTRRAEKKGSSHQLSDKNRLTDPKQFGSQWLRTRNLPT